jgi:uncharacterized phage-associated protein
MSMIPFQPRKAVQAAAVLLKAEPDRKMSRLRLLKLLYIADRESLQRRARPITGDHVAAMDHGPVLSKTYGLIKGEGNDAAVGGQFMRQSRPPIIELAADPGEDELSHVEVALLREVAARYAHLGEWDLVDLTHDFPEWKKNEPPKGSRTIIPLEDILEATGLAAQKPAIISHGLDETIVRRTLSADAA